MHTVQQPCSLQPNPNELSSSMGQLCYQPGTGRSRPPSSLRSTRATSFLCSANGAKDRCYGSPKNLFWCVIDIQASCSGSHILDKTPSPPLITANSYFPEMIYPRPRKNVSEQPKHVAFRVHHIPSSTRYFKKDVSLWRMPLLVQLLCTKALHLP